MTGLHQSSALGIEGQSFLQIDCCQKPLSLQIESSNDCKSSSDECKGLMGGTKCIYVLHDFVCVGKLEPCRISYAWSRACSLRYEKRVHTGLANSSVKKAGRRKGI